MVKAKKNGQMVHFLKANIKMVKNMEKANFLGQIIVIIQVNQKKIIYMVQENMFGQIKDNMLEIGMKIKGIFKIINKINIIYYNKYN